MSMKILYVGQQSEEMQLLSEVIQQTNCKLFHAKDAKQGIYLAVQNLPQLILIKASDYRDGGVEFMTFLKTLPAFQSTSMVAILDENNIESKQNYRSAGFTDVALNGASDYLAQYLSQKKTHSADSSKTTTQRSTQVESKRTLIVTKDEALRQELSRKFHASSFVTDTEKIGVAAIRSLRNYIPDVMVIDMSVPTAFGLMSYIRHHERTKNIKIIALTDNYWLMHTWEGQYADVVLVKPALVEDIYDIAQQFSAKALRRT